MQVSCQLEQNIRAMQAIFARDGMIRFHRFEPQRPELAHLKCCLFFIDGMADARQINEHIIRPLVGLRIPQAPDGDPARWLESQVFQLGELRGTGAFAPLVEAVLSGDTVIFIDGSTSALVAGTKGFAFRGIEEPGGETVLRGPREGFVEPMIQNLALLRRKLKTPDLCIETFTLGTQTRTPCCYCYIAGLVDRRVLRMAKNRVRKIKIDGLFDTNYVAELIEDRRRSPLKTVGVSERPDVVAAKLLEGRVAIFVDGSPVALTLPHVFLENFQAPEDYYVGAHFASFNRMLRVAGFFVSSAIVPVYVALTTYNMEFLPTSLLVSIAVARQGVLLPTLAEAVLLLLAFDVLREAGARTPANIGQTLSIVGALVVGQAAVEARFVSAPMLIIVAISGITGLSAARLKGVVIAQRIFLLVMASVLGIHGFVLGVCFLLLGLAAYRSFGVPMLRNMPFSRTGSSEDVFVRTPFDRMRPFGRFLAGSRRPAGRQE